MEVRNLTKMQYVEIGSFPYIALDTQRNTMKPGGETIDTID